ncbi:MAG TPA: aldo/keto reductase [archaeon]|nr:aldo/keto reductase [archaeon]
MDRRSFIEKGLLAAGGISLTGNSPAAKEEIPGQDKARGSMKYRTLGRTGLKVSEVCFGTFGWQDTPVLEAAVNAGINLISTCADYQSGGAERALAPIVATHRENLVISSGIDCYKGINEQEMLERLDKSLKDIGTDHLDIYVPHQAAEIKDVTNPDIPKAFEKMKKNGKANYLGISTHSSDLENMLNRAIDLGYFDIILCKYNFMEYKNQMKIFERASQAGIGIIVFKIRAGAQELEVEALQKKKLELNHARMRWALSNPNVSSVCMHFTNFSAVESCLEAVNKKLSYEDRRLLDHYRSSFADKYCRNCGTCSIRCPHGVDVASVMRYQMYYKYYGFEKVAIENYKALPQEAKPLPCENCPAPCETACPHGLATRKNLLQAHSLLTLA